MSLLALCVAIGVGLGVASYILDRAGRAGLELGLRRLGADLIVVPRGFETELLESLMVGQGGLTYMDESVSARLASLEYVEATAPQLFIRSLTGASCCSLDNVFLIGFDVQSDFTVEPWIEPGVEWPINPDECLAGAALEVESGETLRFFGRSFRVAGRLAPTGWALDTTIFIPLVAAYEMAELSSREANRVLDITPRDISAVLVRLKEPGRHALHLLEIARDIETRIPEAGVVLPDRELTMVRRSLNFAVNTARSVSLLVWPFMVALLALVFAMMTRERRREIGILRACGGSRLFVFRLIVGEAAMICSLGATLGFVLSSSLLAVFAQKLTSVYRMPLLWPTTWELAGVFLFFFVGAVSTGMIAASLPALAVCRREPYEAMRRGDS